MKNADYAIAEMIERANPSARSLFLAVTYARDYFNQGPDIPAPADEVARGLGQDFVCHVQVVSSEEPRQLEACMYTLAAAEEIALSNM